MWERTSCDAEAGEEVVEDGEDGRLGLQRRPVGLDAAVERDSDDERHIEPVDVLVPVGLGDGLLGDVRPLGVVFGVAVGLRLAGHGRRSLRGELWWSSHHG